MPETPSKFEDNITSTSRTLLEHNLTLSENNQIMPRTNVDQVPSEPQSKLYVRYSKPVAFDEENVTRRSDIDNELYLDVLATSLRNLGSDPLHDAENEPQSAQSSQNDDIWEGMYLQFKGIVNKTGHTNISSHPEHDNLKDWINRQILNKPFLSESQFLKLDKLGVNWSIVLSRDHAWELMFRRLEDFNKTFGHCRVPHGWEKDKQLALWVMRQRRMNMQGKILDIRRLLLNRIGFIWAIQETFNIQWENFFQQLADFKKEFGHCNVPGKNIKLVSWIERQRLSKKKKILSSQREQRLNELDFIWEFDKIKKDGWQEKYLQLADFNRAHGHSFVPVKYNANKLLGNWVALQRKLQAQGKLSDGRLKKLDKLNFVWSAHTRTRLQLEYDLQWERNFRKLTEYKHLHGTCQVSLKSDPLLQAWAVWQRKMFYEGRMASHRIVQLNSISFPWSLNEGYWEKMFDLLYLFNNRFGHTRVPSQWAENRRLAAWVYRMRTDKSKLDLAKVALLNKLDFEWTIHHKIVAGWPAMYDRFLKFKKDLGHTKVPVRWPDDPKLGKWVSRMRSEKKKLSKERLALLQAAEFHW